MTFHNITVIIVINSIYIYVGHGNSLININASKKGGNYQESKQSCTTPEPGYHVGKGQKQIKNAFTVCQEVSPFTAGDHKAGMNRHESMTNTRHKNTNDTQKKHRLGMVSKIFKLQTL